MTPVTREVRGFMFLPDNRVVLVHESGIGLNGVGGVLEVGEPSRAAMVRAFTETTGVETLPHDWTSAGWLTSPECVVDLLWAAKDAFDDVTVTERVVIAKVDDLSFLQVVPNLHWIIPYLQDPDPTSLLVTYP